MIFANIYAQSANQIIDQSSEIRKNANPLHSTLSLRVRLINRKNPMKTRMQLFERKELIPLREMQSLWILPNNTYPPTKEKTFIQIADLINKK